VATLRGDPRHRPPVDPGLAGGLRDWLEDGIAPFVGARPAGSEPLVVRPFDVWSALHVPPVAPAAHRPVADAPPTDASTGPPFTRRLVAASVHALFRQLVTTGRIADPMADALDALRVDAGGSGTAGLFELLDPAATARLREEVERQAAVLVTCWTRLPPQWLPRTRDRIRVALAGGRVVLEDVLDLVVGDPPTTTTSLCVVQLRTGPPQAGHREDLGCTALFETVRSGAPPFRIASFYSADGHLEIEDVTDGLLVGAVERTIRAIGQLSTTTDGPGADPR
jgi:hypothetical protein